LRMDPKYWIKKKKKRKKLQATSAKLQAWQQLWEMVGWINERYIMDNEQLKRIADILDEILRIIKKDMGIKWKNSQ